MQAHACAPPAVAEGCCVREPRRILPAPLLAALVVGLGVALVVSPAHAQEASAQAPPAAYRFTARGSAGIGPGAYGVAARAGVSAEGWLTDHVGLGGAWGTSSAGPFLSMSGGTRENLELLGATAALRTAPYGSYGVLTLGAGYAWGQDVNGSGIFGAPPTVTQVTAFLVDVSGAWVFHDGPIGFGPGLHVDVLTQGAETVTFEVNLGLAL